MFARIYFANIIFAVIYHNHFLAQHGYFKSVLILHQDDVLALESAYASSAHFGEETHLVAYLHVLNLFSVLLKDKFTAFLRNTGRTDDRNVIIPTLI